jgi:hypothetical protein
VKKFSESFANFSQSFFWSIVNSGFEFGQPGTKSVKQKLLATFAQRSCLGCSELFVNLLPFEFFGFQGDLEASVKNNSSIEILR